MKSFALMIVFLSTFSYGGIVSIGNGGGFAEMVVTKLDQQMPALISACLAKPQICQLADNEKIVLKTMIDKLPAAQTKPIRFLADCEDHISLGLDSVQIPSCLLYLKQEDSTKSTQALPVLQLSWIAFQARVEQISAENSLSVQLDAKFFEKIFSTLSLQVQSAPLIYHGEELFLKTVRIGASYYTFEKSLIIETPAESLDATSELTQLLCPETKIEDFEMRTDISQIISPNRFYFEGDLTWKCDRFSNRNYKARLNVTGVINNEKKVTPNSVRLQLRKKEVVWR